MVGSNSQNTDSSDNFQRITPSKERQDEEAKKRKAEKKSEEPKTIKMNNT